MAGKTTDTKKTTTRSSAAKSTGKAAKPAVRRTAKPVSTPVPQIQETPIVQRVRQEKPLISLGTWITILILAVLVGFTIYLNRAETPLTDSEETPAVSQPFPLFTGEDGVPTSIEITSTEGNGGVKLARNAEKVWMVELPIEGEADQGFAEAAASQVTALRGQLSIEGKPGIYGLDHPGYIITVIFDSGKEHTIEVGSTTPSNSGYYVRIDNKQMAIVDFNGIEALLQLGFNPPYLNTPTPTPLPATPTPVPPTQTESAPEVTATPTP